VLPISELVQVARTVTEDGSSPLALSAAQAWNYSRVRFLRSSANHVFVCTAPDRANAVLRFRSNGDDAIDQPRRIAELATRLATEGAPVAPAITTEDGRLVVAVPGPQRRYVASLFAAVSGPQLEADTVTPANARSWGQALARLHETASQLNDRPRLPCWLEVVTEAVRGVRDRALRHVADTIIDGLGRLPTSVDAVGVVHGDAELDNVIWVHKGSPVFVDLDDASWSWFAADICFALRDFAEPGGVPSLRSQTVASFVAGYRERRPLTDEELGWLPLFARAHTLITLARLERPRSEPVGPDWPDWAKVLKARLDAIAVELQSALLSAPSAT
jgi:Ser/Thr protein kinase RdoA (MazF antagonist)